ncbi:MAG: LLM class flavin-dependent oxidoreductase [Chloroflexi bacterium]|nr:LLM class flavin-dependent oxidoreductase [Chloroflexota bacterium]MCI0895625.1 LLM class flavin-dependent oxidoreductase [Chloroflexota bacterium]
MERIGLSFSGGLPPTDIVDCIQLADELGYESAWMAEGHGGDQFSVLTACALRTKNILLGTSITSVFVRSAPTIAMAAATVDHFSQGRFVLGLGTSHKVQVEPEHGLLFEKAVPRLRECVQIVRSLLQKGEVSYQGSVYNIENFDFWFEPFRKEIPIYVAAVFPKMLEVCGEIAQGALMTWCTLEHAETAAYHVAEGAKRAGRNPNEVEVATLLPCAAGSSGEGAMEGLKTNIARYAARFPRYRRLMENAGFTEELQAVRRAWNEGDQEKAIRLVPAELIDKIALVGSADQCRARLEEYRRAGITQPIISPRVSGANPKEEAMQIIRACAPR